MYICLDVLGIDRIEYLTVYTTQLLPYMLYNTIANVLDLVNPRYHTRVSSRRAPMTIPTSA